MPKRVCSVCENAKKYLTFFEKNFSFWYNGHIKSSFHNAAEKLSPEGQKFLAHFWKRIAHTQNFQQIFFLPSSLVETYISVLAILLEDFWQKTEKVCTINENLKKVQFSRKSSLKCSSGHVVYCFYNRKVFVRCPKVTEKSFFCRNAFLKLYLLRHNMQFFQPCRKKLEGRPNFFPVIVRKRFESLNSIIENIFRRIAPMDM